jgi:hypothetical protein
MDPDEWFVLAVGIAVASGGIAANSTARMPALYFRDAAGAGLVRLATWLAMLWILVVLLRFADPSVTGIYVGFYLVLGYAVVKALAPAAAGWFGARFRVDVCERHNHSAALVHAGLVLAGGMIFGGCLWGEADPVTDDEGGWWIPLGFFAAGWAVLLGAMALFFWREPGPTRLRIRRDRSVGDGQAAGAYAVAAAWVLTEAVAGDFHGWRHGLLAVGFIAVLLGLRELHGVLQNRLTITVTGGRSPRRAGESALYLLTGLVFWLLNRALAGWLEGWS